jgi:hypothetical protein
MQHATCSGRRSTPTQPYLLLVAACEAQQELRTPQEDDDVVIHEVHNGQVLAELEWDLEG